MWYFIFLIDFGILDIMLICIFMVREVYEEFVKVKFEDFDVELLD